MPDEQPILMRDGVLVLEGDVIPNAYAAYYEGGAFCPDQVRVALDGRQGDLTVRVNSAGGDPREGEAIRVMLAEYPGQVTVQVVGMACSAASLMIMSAGRIEMSAGSVMMIHDPSTITCGNADDHQGSIDVLNTMADAYAAVYAARSGRTAAEMRQIMRDELWMGPDQAISEGFADALMGIDQPEPALDDAVVAARTQYEHTMQSLRAVAMKVDPSPMGEGDGAALRGQSMAMTAATQEADMPEENVSAEGGQTTPVQAPVGQPVQMSAQVDGAAERAAGAAEERRRIADIQMAARPHIASGALDQAMVDSLIDEGVTPQMASHRMLQALSSAPGQDNVQMTGQRARITRDERETRVIGMTEALVARLTDVEAEDDRAAPYADLAMHEMAAVAMGRERPTMGGYAQREEILMQAMHTTSDFPNILSTSVNRVLASNYELETPTFQAVSREMSFNDFREHDVVRPDEFPTLQKVNESGEIKFGQIGDSKETVVLQSYGTGLSISRQALVNDDLGAIQEVIESAGAIVPEFEEATFWAYFLSNAALGDGVAMFHADHGNVAASGTSITKQALSAGRKALRTMKAADGVRTIAANAPAILLVGPELETDANEWCTKDIIQAAKIADHNPFAGTLTPVVTEMITDASWYLLVAPSRRTCNFRHGYLSGRPAPRVRVNEPFGVQGMRMTLEHDFGVGGVNYRGAYKNAGA